MKENKELTDILFDKDCREHIVIPDDYGDEAEFEKVAVIPIVKDGVRRIYALLRPTPPIWKGNEENVYVFRVETTEKGAELIFETDKKIMAEAFDKYEVISGKRIRR